MRKFFLKYGYVIAALALIVVSNNINAACSHFLYQSKVPDSAKKLRRF